jgi:hypothetical protein
VNPLIHAFWTLFEILFWLGVVGIGYTLIRCALKRRGDEHSAKTTVRPSLHLSQYTGAGKRESMPDWFRVTGGE